MSPIFEKLRYVVSKKETVKERLAKCVPCENNKFGICKECGCVINFKIQLANEKCPIDIWGEEPEKTSE